MGDAATTLVLERTVPELLLASALLPRSDNDDSSAREKKLGRFSDRKSISVS
jgi:hypothetical protein